MPISENRICVCGEGTMVDIGNCLPNSVFCFYKNAVIAGDYCLSRDPVFQHSVWRGMVILLISEPIRMLNPQRSFPLPFLE